MIFHITATSEQNFFEIFHFRLMCLCVCFFFKGTCEKIMSEILFFSLLWHRLISKEASFSRILYVNHGTILGLLRTIPGFRLKTFPGFVACQRRSLYFTFLFSYLPYICQVGNLLTKYFEVLSS